MKTILDKPTSIIDWFLIIFASTLLLLPSSLIPFSLKILVISSYIVADFQFFQKRNERWILRIITLGIAFMIAGSLFKEYTGIFSQLNNICFILVATICLWVNRAKSYGTVITVFSAIGSALVASAALIDHASVWSLLDIHFSTIVGVLFVTALLVSIQDFKICSKNVALMLSGYSWAALQPFFYLIEKNVPDATIIFSIVGSAFLIGWLRIYINDTTKR